MNLGGRYDLGHPDAEAVYVANSLWWKFGEEPTFRVMLDRIYSETTALLDVVARYLTPASSLDGLVFNWQEMESLVSVEPTAPSLSDQMRDFQNAAEQWGLRCAWAPHSLMYTLGKAHQQRLTSEANSKLFPKQHRHISEYVPRWHETDELTPSGLINPNSGSFVGVMEFSPDGNSGLRRADNSPPISFSNAGPEGFTLPDGATPEDLKDLSHNYLTRREDVKEMYRREGMVDPTLREDLNQTIEWLYNRLRFPEIGWRRMTHRINEELGQRRRQLQLDLYPDVPPEIHADYTYSNVAYHTNRLIELLRIDRPPGMQDKFG